MPVLILGVPNFWTKSKIFNREKLAAMGTRTTDVPICQIVPTVSGFSADFRYIGSSE